MNIVIPSGLLFGAAWVLFITSFTVSLWGIISHDTPAYYWKRLFHRRKRLSPQRQAAARAQAAIEDLATFKTARRQREIAAWMTDWVHALPAEQKSETVKVKVRDECDHKEGEWKTVPERVVIRDAAGTIIAEYDGPDTATFVDVLQSDTPRGYRVEHFVGGTR